MMLTIGQAARRADVSTDTLRYYEREGLVAPRGKSGGGYRLYDADVVQRLGFVKKAQQCGFSLAEIRQLLQLRASDRACCDDVRRLAVEKRLQLEAKIRAMRVMSHALDRLIADCGDRAAAVADCPILAALEAGESALRDQR